MGMVDGSMLATVVAILTAFDGFPWSRVPLKASPGIGRPELMNGNRTSGTLSDQEVAWLASNHDIVIVSGATQDSANTSICAESKIADVAKRFKVANPKVRMFVYFPSSQDETKIQHYCGERIFSQHPEWRVKLPNGDDFVQKGTNDFVHDLTQPAVRKWWIAASTNASFFGFFDGVFADNAIANEDQIITADGTRLNHTAGKALLAGQQTLYDELRAALAASGGNKRVIFNGIRQGQKFAAVSNLLPHADGGEMEGFLNGVHQRFQNGSLDPSKMVPTILTLIRIAQLSPQKQVLLKTAPGPGMTSGWPNHSMPSTPAEFRAAALHHARFPLAAFLIVAGPQFILDYTWGYRSNDYVPPADDSGAVPGVSGLQSMVPRGWFPDFMRAPGTPLTKATFDGEFTFSREWTGVSVTVNVKDETAKLAWKKKK